MKKPMKLMVGDVVTTKKNHPCGSNVFTLTRVGMDIRMKCHGCGKEIWIDRPDLEKRIKKLVSAEESQEQENPSPQEEI